MRALNSPLDLLTLNTEARDEKRLASLANRKMALRALRYVWRCFGDAIAFTYSDRFSLKQAYYNIENTDVKHDAGYISTKAGLMAEIKTMQKLIEVDKFPCLLVDLTNTLRYGDIAILLDPDPYFLEVKSSHSNDSRSKKQLRKIRKLHAFYETGFVVRGGVMVKGREIVEKPKLYIDELNHCIERAYAYGYSVVQPERGFFLLSITDGSPSNIPETARPPWVCYLNMCKIQQSWAPYSPFTLSILSEKALYDFIVGKLIIIAVIDMDLFSIAASQHNYAVEIYPDDPYPIRLKGPEGSGQISYHLLRRCALEFMSPAWLIQNWINGLQHWSGVKTDQGHS